MTDHEDGEHVPPVDFGADLSSAAERAVYLQMAATLDTMNRAFNIACKAGDLETQLCITRAAMEWRDIGERMIARVRAAKGGE